MTFREWMKLVDTEIERLCGLSYRDLDDAPYRDWYDAELDPLEAAEEALENARFPIDS